MMSPALALARMSWQSSMQSSMQSLASLALAARTRRMSGHRPRSPALPRRGRWLTPSSARSFSARPASSVSPRRRCTVARLCQPSTCGWRVTLCSRPAWLRPVGHSGPGARPARWPPDSSADRRPAPPGSRPLPAGRAATASGSRPGQCHLNLAQQIERLRRRRFRRPPPARAAAGRSSSSVAGDDRGHCRPPPARGGVRWPRSDLALPARSVRFLQSVRPAQAPACPEVPCRHWRLGHKPCRRSCGDEHPLWPSCGPAATLHVVLAWAHKLAGPQCSSVFAAGRRAWRPAGLPREISVARACGSSPACLLSRPGGERLRALDCEPARVAAAGRASVNRKCRGRLATATA